MFVFKLGLAKLQCCLLMNGLVFDSNQVLLKVPLPPSPTCVPYDSKFSHFPLIVVHKAG